MDALATLNIIGAAAVVTAAVAWMLRSREQTGCDAGGCASAGTDGGARAVRVPTSALSLGRRARDSADTPR